MNSDHLRRFEAAWSAGQRPRIEEYLGDVPELEQAALLVELLALELEQRELRGECPTQAEYRARFPAYARPIAAAFGETVPPRRGRPAPQPVHSWQVRIFKDNRFVYAGAFNGSAELG